MPDWIKKSLSGTAGLTQVPAGKYLAAVRQRFGGGAVVLMIDVSGSMSGRPINEAVLGAEQFVREAVAARYHVGVMLWHTEVVGLSTPSVDAEDALRVLRRAVAGGGNNLLGPLLRCHQVLDGFSGDRVVALFGDGDLTPKAAVLEQVAQMKAENIRFVTRGLGASAAAEFGEISDEESDKARVDRVEDLAAGIAGMAASLTSHGGLRRD